MVKDDLISRSEVLAALSSRLSIVDMIRVAEIVESIPVATNTDVLESVEFCDFESGQYFRTSAVTTESTGTVVMLERID